MVIKTTHFVNLIWPSDRAENNDFTRDRVTLVDIFELSAFSFTHVAETGLEKHTHCLLKKRRYVSANHDPQAAVR